MDPKANKVNRNLDYTQGDAPDKPWPASEDLKDSAGGPLPPPDEPHRGDDRDD